MLSAPTYISDHERVLRVYGYWPSFHDAEIISVKLDRSRILFGSVHNARIELVIHCFQMTREKEQFELVKHNLVHFEFDSVSDVNLREFNHQNAIFELIFEELPLDKSGNHSFKVILNPAFGIWGEFIASAGRVLSVVPCDKEGNQKDTL